MLVAAAAAAAVGVVAAAASPALPAAAGAAVALLLLRPMPCGVKMRSASCRPAMCSSLSSSAWGGGRRGKQQWVRGGHVA
jgi:hypothetical protein